MARQPLLDVAAGHSSSGWLAATVDEWLAASDLAPSTQTQYRWHLLQGELSMEQWLTEQGVRKMSDITRTHLVFWRKAVADRYAPATLNQAVSACRRFFRWVEQEDKHRSRARRFGLTEPLHDAVRLPRIPTKAQDTVLPHEFETLLASFDPHTPKGVRDAALLSLLYETGMRSHEFVALTLADLDLTTGRVRIVSRKGGDSGESVIGTVCRQRLLHWLEVRAEFAPETDALWIAVSGPRRGSPMKKTGLRTIIMRWCQTAGIRRLSPHDFRRGSAYFHLKRGTSREWVLRQFGWTDETMYRHYTQALPLHEFENPNSILDNLDGHDGKHRETQLPLWAEPGPGARKRVGS